MLGVVYSGEQSPAEPSSSQSQASVSAGPVSLWPARGRTLPLVHLRGIREALACAQVCSSPAERDGATAGPLGAAEGNVWIKPVVCSVSPNLPLHTPSDGLSGRSERSSAETQQERSWRQGGGDSPATSLPSPAGSRGSPCTPAHSSGMWAQGWSPQHQQEAASTCLDTTPFASVGPAQGTPAPPRTRNPYQE